MGSVRATEKKVKVGDLDINYVRSALIGRNPSKTLLLLPGAMGKVSDEMFLQIFIIF
jgi:hypothetical protein